MEWASGTAARPGHQRCPPNLRGQSRHDVSMWTLTLTARRVNRGGGKGENREEEEEYDVVGEEEDETSEEEENRMNGPADGF